MHHVKAILCRPFIRAPWAVSILMAMLCALALTAGCGRDIKPESQPPVEVSVTKVKPRHTPVTTEFVGQTQSSHQVEIRARVNGFLDKRAYTEGSFVQKGQVMFEMDPKPFQAQLDAALGALTQQQARLTTARSNLARVKPLVEQDALSQKDLDDAVGQEQATVAAVESAKADAQQARLNLSYTTISAPVAGFSSYARIQGGAYVNQENSLLTYVSRVDPIWVNFSISENDHLKYLGESRRGQVIEPKGEAYNVEIVLADGTLFPKRGRLIFADAEYSKQTGTFLLRATIPNPGAVLRPGQFVHVHVLGAIRPNAITVPQRAVQQGTKGHFVWVVNKEGKTEYRPVTAGDWIGNDWLITEGLASGDQVVVDGGLTLRPGEPVTAKPLAAEAVPATVNKPPQSRAAKDEG